VTARTSSASKHPTKLRALVPSGETDDAIDPRSRPARRPRRCEAPGASGGIVFALFAVAGAAAIGWVVKTARSA
jgi:hypothetical protein